MRGKPFDKNDPRINRGGRPKGVASLRAGLQRVVSREDCERMGLRLVGMARRGNLRAMKLVGELLGDLGNSPLAVALAQTAVAQTCNDAGNVHLYLPRKDGAPDAVQFNVGVSALELPESESRLTAEQWEALIKALESEGGQLVKRGDSIVHVPATKGEIDLDGVSNLARQLYGIPATAQGNGSGNAPAEPGRRAIRRPARTAGNRATSTGSATAGGSEASEAARTGSSAETREAASVNALLDKRGRHVRH